SCSSSLGVARKLPFPSYSALQRRRAKKNLFAAWPSHFPSPLLPSCRPCGLINSVVADRPVLPVTASSHLLRLVASAPPRRSCSRLKNILYRYFG
ncbi:hypothetical protein HN873_001504, partial [Arachis hypogaea]